MDLPTYRCHKDVRAMKIGTIEPQPHPGVILRSERTPWLSLQVSPAYFEKHKPQPGGYYVLDADGDESFSPAKAFEGGYTRIGDNMTFGDRAKLAGEGPCERCVGKRVVGPDEDAEGKQLGAPDTPACTHAWTYLPTTDEFECLGCSAIEHCPPGPTYGAFAPTIALQTCRRCSLCGAMVHLGDAVKHSAWHADAEKFKQYLECARLGRDLAGGNPLRHMSG